MHPEATEQTRDRDMHPTADPPASPSAEQWFTYLGGEVFGPLTLAEMHALANEGRLTPQSQTTRRSPPEWKGAGEDERLAAFFSQSAPRISPSPTQPAGDPPLLAVKPSTGSTSESAV